MKKLVLAALLATTAVSSLDAAVVISFGGIDDVTNDSISGTLTVNTAALPANTASAPGDLEYFTYGPLLSAIVSYYGANLPTSGAVADSTIYTIQDFGTYGSGFTLGSETDSGLPTQESWVFSIYSDVPAPTVNFSGFALPDLTGLAGTGHVFYTVEHSINNGATLYALNTGAVTSLNYVDTDAGAVPEPASWAMMIGGFGLVGGAMRRRRTSVAFA